jgi:polyisoprenoid-binding protein YceI
MKSINYFIFSLLSLSLLFSCKSDPKESKTKDNSDETIEQKVVLKENKHSNNGTYALDNNASVVYWTGSKPAGTHNGGIKVKSGEIRYEDGSLAAGKFTADMTSINVTDLEGDEKYDLENHLKGKIKGKENHFFNVEKYPESQFIIKSVEEVNGKYRIYGVLTIKDISNPVKLNAQIKFGHNNESLKLKSDEFTIDRTQWGIEYMSKSIFDDLKERFIDDEIKLKINLKADKKS